MIRRMLLLVCLASLVAVQGLGCAGSPTKDDNSLTGGEHRVPEFYDKIPATSPYVLTSVKPFPMEIIEPYLETYGQMYAGFQKQYQAQNYQPKRTEDKFIKALFDEMGKVDSVEGYKKLGLSTRPEMAVYGIGWFPVMRLTLGDPQAFEAALSRVETKSGVDVRMRKAGEQIYREYELGAKAKVAVAVTDSEFVLGVGPAKQFEEFVAYMLGQKKAARTLADVDVIQDIQSKYEFTPYLVGYVNIADIAGTAMGAAPGDPITKAMLQAMDFKAPDMTEVCRQEYMSIFEKMPRAVVGYTELTPETMEMTAVLETKGEFAKNLAAISAPIPGYSNELVDKSFFAVGLGVDVKKALAFAAQQAQKINQDPYQCPSFQRWNQMAQQAKMAMQMVPPFVSSIRGAMTVVTKAQFAPRTMAPQSFDGMALIQSGDPMALFSQLRQFLPQLQGLSLKPNGVPVALPQLPNAPYLQSPHVAMDQDTLAASVGVGMQDDMAVLLENQGATQPAHSPLLLIAYDYGRLMKKFTTNPIFGPSPGGQGMNDAMSAMQKMFGTFVAEVDASDQGIILRYRANMFPEAGAKSASSP